ncbi:hypothetical protein FRC00_005491, partial [Tulasnella sp. 408]
MAALRVDHLAQHPSQSRPPQLAPIAAQQPPHQPSPTGPLPPPHHQHPAIHAHHHAIPSIDGASSSSGLVPPAQPTPADISHQAVKMNGRKRKKQEDPDDPLAPGSQAPPAPPSLSLDHFSFVVVASNLINGLQQCDSKLPSCSACQAANVECNQEDRHRQTLKPRGYTDMVEAQLAKCILILDKFIPGFRLTDIDGILDREGIVIPPNPTPMDGDATTLNPALGAILQANSAALVGPAVGGASAVKVEPIVPSLSSGQATSAAGGHQRRSEGASDGSSTVYEGRQTNGSNHPSVSTQPQSQQQQQPSGGANGNAIRGQDPMSNNLSSADGLIKAFGVSRSIVRELPKPENSEGEDVLGGVRLEDDSPLPTYPKTVSQWTDPLLARNDPAIPQLPTPNPPPYPQPSLAGPQLPAHIVPPQSPTSSTQLPTGPLSFHPSIQRNRLPLRLPRNRQSTGIVVKKYFDRLNYHRPVFIPEEFDIGLNALYHSLENGNASPRRMHASPFDRNQPPSSVPLVPQDDPGFLCSVYLILALGRLAIDNEAMHRGTDEPPPTNALKDFPTHEEFFELALAVKPDLRVTISSLQALILLQWYLYTE